MADKAQHWGLSMNGNPVLKFGKRGCTVFETRHGTYKYVIEGDFSDEEYGSEEDAKSYALEAIDALDADTA